MTEFFRNHWSVAASGVLRTAPLAVLTPVMVMISFKGFSVGAAAAMAAAMLLLSLAANVVIWRRTRFYFLDDEMVVERNALFRSEKRIQYDRLASVNEERDPVCRLLGATRLSFNLNSSVNAAQAEATIVLKSDEARALRERMDSRIFGKAPVVQEGFREGPASLVDVTFGDIVLHSMFGMPSLQAGFGAVMLAYSIVTFVVQGSPSLLATLFFVLDFLIPALSSFFRLYGYRITRSGDAVSVQSGFFSTKEDSFLLSKVNCVRMRESLLCRLMGRAILEVEVVGTADRKGVPLLCPLKPKEVATGLFHGLLPEFECSAEPMGQCRVSLVGISLKAAAVVSAALVVSYIIYLQIDDGWAPIALLAGIVMAALCAAWAARAYRVRTFACDGDIAAVVTGAFDKVSDFILLDKIQFVDVRSSPVQRRKGAASCRINMLSTSGAASVTSGVFPAEELERVSSTVLDRIKDGRYDFRRFQRSLLHNSGITG